MRTDWAYEIHDFRETDTKLDGVGVIRSGSGSLAVHTMSGSQHIDWADEHEIIDDEPGEALEIHMDSGRVVFLKLRVPSWEKNYRPQWGGDVPKFQNDEALHAWVNEALRGI